MVLKLAVLGLLGYLRDKANIFDGIIVTVSIVEVAIAPPLILFPGTCCLLGICIDANFAACPVAWLCAAALGVTRVMG